MNGVDSDRIIDAYTQWKRSERGWVLVGRDSKGGQYSIPKRYSSLAFWVGLLTCWIYGFGVLIWILGGIDYIFSGKSTFYVDVRQMEQELKARKK